MPTLLVLRHAKAEPVGDDVPDRDRPLSPDGLHACEKLAEHVRAGEIAVDLVLCSPALRARQTLEEVSRGFPSAAEVVVDPGLYDAAVEDVVGGLRAVQGAATVMVVGHNPTLEELVLNLVEGGDDLERVREGFPSGALARLHFDGAWEDLGPGGALLASYFVPPKRGS